MGVLLRDLKFALRMLGRSPGVTALALVTLALGIGGNTAVFSVVRAVLLRPLQYPAPERLVALEGHAPGVDYPNMGLSEGEVVEMASGSEVMSVGAYTGWAPTLVAGGEAERINGVAASGGFFAALGVQPALGRPISLEDERPGAPDVVVISDRLWRRRFGADRGVLGRTVTLNGRPHTVVGVMPGGYEDPTDLTAATPAELWGALTINRAAPSRGSHSWDSVARLAPGVSPEQAQAWVAAQGARIAAAHPDFYPPNLRYSLSAQPLQRKLVGEVRSALLVLLGAVALVLLIACANVANLLLARAAQRQRELAVRAALGAGRAQLIRQLLTESALLSLCGGALGMLVAHAGVSAMVSLAPSSLPRAAAIGLDLPVLLFTGGLALCTGLLFGLAPALQLRDRELYASLGAGAVGVQGRGGKLMRSLVAAEMVLALTVLIGAGLLLRSFWKLTHQETGYHAGNVLTLYLPLPKERYPEGPRVAAFYEELVRRVEALPGVQRAAAVTPMPMTERTVDTVFHVQGRPLDPAKLQVSELKFTTAGYFELMGLRAVRGRVFTAADGAEAPLVVAINQTMARRTFPGEEPLGKRIELMQSPKLRNIYAEVVGVIGDSRNKLAADVRPEIYLPHAQSLRATVEATRWMSLAVKSKGSPASALTAEVLREVRALDPELAPADVRTFDEVLSIQAAQPRFNFALLSAFALVALLLGVVGVYGVLSTWVAQRTREIGVRLALGAARGELIRLVLVQGLWPVLAGLGIGLVISAGLTRLVASLLFGVAPLDWPTFVAVPALLLAAAALAALLPAWRATRVDPMEALRAE